MRKEERLPSSIFHPPSSVLRLPSFRDDRGVAMLEGILIFALIAGVLLGCILLGQWGTHLQYTQMGARLLTFNAGTASVANNDSVAKFRRFGDQAEQRFSRDSVEWGTYSGFGILPVSWIDVFFVLPNDRYTGSVRGKQPGRLPGQGPSLFDFSPTSMGYHSRASAATNAWADTAANVEFKFMGLAYWVGYNEMTPEGLDHIPEVPRTNPDLPLLESIYTRVGVGHGP